MPWFLSSMLQLYSEISQKILVTEMKADSVDVQNRVKETTHALQPPFHYSCKIIIW